MVELQHRAVEPAELVAFRASNPHATAADFDSLQFRETKKAVKVALNQDQDGLCVYCEKKLAPTEGQIDHIKPKAGTNAHPDLCFSYQNYAHSCISHRTCGQAKGNRLLPIEPGPGCNREWQLSQDGTIEPVPGLTRTRKHQVKQTRDMLGLNADPVLVSERRDWVRQAIEILRQMPHLFPEYLQDKPYRHILATLAQGNSR